MTQSSPSVVFNDPIMQSLYDKVHTGLGPLREITLLEPDRYFWELCESILGQQLSEKVAPQIVARVKTVLEQELSPQKVLSTPDADLRAAGVSFAKISYLKNVATAWLNGDIDPHALHQLEDEDVIQKLITIKGVGRWTAEMFLIFTLARPDVFSPGDYGLRRGILLAYQLPAETKPKELIELSLAWAPQRSLASRVLWKSLELV